MTININDKKEFLKAVARGEKSLDEYNPATLEKWEIRYDLMSDHDLRRIVYLLEPGKRMTDDEQNELEEINSRIIYK